MGPTVRGRGFFWGGRGVFHRFVTLFSSANQNININIMMGEAGAGGVGVNVRVNGCLMDRRPVQGLTWTVLDYWWDGVRPMKSNR